MRGILFMAILCKIPAHQLLTFHSTPSPLCFSLFTWHYLEKQTSWHYLDAESTEPSSFRHFLLFTKINPDIDLCRRRLQKDT